MPMQLRSNLGNRLILRVDSEVRQKSRLSGDKGAERLLRRGHMVAKLEGHPGLTYCQVPMLTSSDIGQLVSALGICAVPLQREEYQRISATAETTASIT